jgi:hypothetical protein
MTQALYAHMNNNNKKENGLLCLGIDISQGGV